MANLNRITLIGRLTNDPELKHTPAGVPIATFGLAIRRPKGKEAAEAETDFIDIVAWRQPAEFATAYLKKGDEACVEGRLQIRKWTAQDGTNRKSAEVVATDVQGTGKRPGTASAPDEGAPADFEADGEAPGPFDDI